MLFTSFEFICLVAVSLLLYYLVADRRWQVGLLMVSSFVFYAWHIPELLTLLIMSILINASTSYVVAKSNLIKARKAYAILGISANLACLVFFKYSSLFAQMLHGRDQVVDFLVLVPLPIGISFFTFQGISLVAETFKNEKKELTEPMVRNSFLRHLFNTGLYISFFPQLLAGPIVKAYDYFPQIDRKYAKDIPLTNAMKTLILGYFLKTVIANNLNGYTHDTFAGNFSGTAGIDLMLNTVMYSVQIFADFAGYSLIAIGLGKLYGYHLPVNFNFPYVARSFSEFWRRWHMTLSSFLKRYLYIPLGGNRKGSIITYRNLMITMVLGGFWHGATLNFAVWGLYHGLLLSFERMTGWRKVGNNSMLRSIIGASLVFAAVSFGWLIFKLPNLAAVGHYLQSTLHNIYRLPSFDFVLYFLLYCSPVFAYHLYHLLSEKEVLNQLEFIKPVIYGTMLFLIATNSGAGVEFIYFQF